MIYCAFSHIGIHDGLLRPAVAQEPQFSQACHRALPSQQNFNYKNSAYPSYTLTNTTKYSTYMLQAKSNQYPNRRVLRVHMIDVSTPSVRVWPEVVQVSIRIGFLVDWSRHIHSQWLIRNSPMPWWWSFNQNFLNFVRCLPEGRARLVSVQRLLFSVRFSSLNLKLFFLNEISECGALKLFICKWWKYLYSVC